MSSGGRSFSQAKQERLLTLDARWGLPIWGWIGIWLGLGALVRGVAFWATEGLHHPDEIGQYLEPAQRLLDGHAVVAWEYLKGARNWLIAWHYTSVLELARLLGFEGLARLQFVRLHNAVLSLLVVPAAFRMGRALGGSLEAAVLSAGATALFPVLTHVSCHALAEWHALLFFSWACTLWCEEATAAPASTNGPGGLWLGLWLGIAWIARPHYGVVLPFVLADYVHRRKTRKAIAVLVGFSVAVAALGIADFFTWGVPFQSLCAWIQYNILDGKTSSLSNLKPYYFYFRQVFWAGLWVAVLPLVGAMYVAWDSCWRGITCWLVPVMVLSCLANKQERFLIPLWPCFLSTAVAAMIRSRAGLMRWQWPGRHTRWPEAFAAIAPTLVMLTALGANLVFVLRKDWRKEADLFQAQDWVRCQSDLTGLAIRHSNPGRFVTGAYLVLDRPVPLVFPRADLSLPKIISHLIASGESEQLAKASPNWEQLARYGRIGIFRRKERLITQGVPSRE